MAHQLVSGLIIVGSCGQLSPPFLPEEKGRSVLQILAVFNVLQFLRYSKIQTVGKVREKKVVIKNHCQRDSKNNSSFLPLHSHVSLACIFHAGFSEISHSLGPLFVSHSICRRLTNQVELFPLTSVHVR
jgi:hypothetical protein